MLKSSDYRVCACCGQEHSAHLIPDVEYSASNELFSPLHGDLVLIPGEPIRACTRCVDVLKTKRRPKWAIRIPLPDVRLTRLTALEFSLIRPVVIIQSVVILPGGEGQCASAGGSANFVNDSIKVARRLPRPLSENGILWVRSKRGALVDDARLRPDMMRESLADILQSHHPAFPNVEFDAEEFDKLASMEATMSEVVVDLPPSEMTPEASAASARQDASEREGIYGPDAKHVAFVDLPANSGMPEILRALYGDAAPNVPGEAEAQPGDAGMLRKDTLQPHFPPEALLNDFEFPRTIFMRLFPQHFTDGNGGLDQAPEELTEAEFIECCLFYHTRQFATDKEFVMFACTVSTSLTPAELYLYFVCLTLEY